MKKGSIEQYRSNITQHLTRISGDLEHIKEKVNDNNKHLEKINGRVRRNETVISWIIGIGSMFAFGVTAFLGFFNIKD